MTTSRLVSPRRGGRAATADLVMGYQGRERVGARWAQGSVPRLPLGSPCTPASYRSREDCTDYWYSEGAPRVRRACASDDNGGGASPGWRASPGDTRRPSAASPHAATRRSYA